MTSEKRTGEPLKGGLEPDALTGWRRFLRLRPGQRRAAKTSYNRRVRRQAVEIERDDES